MRLFEIKIEYHKELNPKIWDGMKLRPEVREQLLLIADEFYDFLDVPSVEVHDVILTGSIANYNWHSGSDVDLHLVIDKSDVEWRCPEFTDDFFTDKKALWNEHHEITIYGFDVELYVQDEKEKHISTGTYSVKNDKWIVKPSYNPPSYDDADIRIKANQIKNEIKRLSNTQAEVDEIHRLKEKLRKYRQAGLNKKGEFSTENLVFKELRNSGYLEKLQKLQRQRKSDELSLP